jgi:hypothetical protein
MTKLVLAVAALLAACDLYTSDDSSPWSYCDNTGLYHCHDQSCTWVSATCTGALPCTASTDCAAGCYCASGTCSEAGFCSNDTDCTTGFVCDVKRSSCEPDPGSCAGVVTCTTPAPLCPEHEVPVVVANCFTGACSAISSCDATPTCDRLQHEDDCLAETGCGATYTGIDCTSPDGTSCTAGDADCTCAHFEFAACTQL